MIWTQGVGGVAPGGNFATAYAASDRPVPPPAGRLVAGPTTALAHAAAARPSQIARESPLRLPVLTWPGARAQHQATVAKGATNLVSDMIATSFGCAAAPSARSQRASHAPVR